MLMIGATRTRFGVTLAAIAAATVLGSTALGYLAAVSPRLEALVVALPLAAVALKWPKSTTIVVIAVYPFLPFWFGITLPIAGPTTVGRGISLCVLAAALVSLLRQREYRRADLFDGLITARCLVVAMWPVILGVAAFGSGLHMLLWSVADVAIPALLVKRLAVDKTWLARCVRVMVLSAALIGALAAFEAVTGVNVFFRFIPMSLHLTEGAVLSRQWRYGFLRAEGPMSVEIILSWYLGLMFVLAFGGMAFAGVRSRLLQAGVLLAIGGGLISTFSGTGIVAAVAGALTVLLLAPRILRRSSWALVIAATAFAASAVAATGRVVDVLLAFFRVRTPVYLTTTVGGNSQGRIAIISHLWPTIREKLFFGYGTLDPGLSVERDLASRYVAEMLTYGLVGSLTMWIPCVFALFGSARYALAADQPGHREIAAALAGTVVATLTAFVAMTSTLSLETILWILLASAWAVGMSHRAGSRAHQRPAHMGSEPATTERTVR